MILPGIYKHYKGNFYRVLFVAKDSNNGPDEDRNVVVYVSLSAEGKTPGRVSVRAEKEFDEYIIAPIADDLTVHQTGVKRFTRIGD